MTLPNTSTRVRESHVASRMSTQHQDYEKRSSFEKLNNLQLIEKRKSKCFGNR